MFFCFKGNQPRFHVGPEGFPPLRKLSFRVPPNLHKWLQGKAPVHSTFRENSQISHGASGLSALQFAQWGLPFNPLESLEPQSQPG